MKSKIYIKYIIFGISLVPVFAFSHSGGTDKYGCHKDNKIGGYHCHNESTTPTTPIISTKPIAPAEIAIKPPTPANACFVAAVDRVIDGDTLSIKTPEGLERIRISQIDAPERSQKFGLEATQCLTNLVSNHTLSVCSDGQDRYGRTIAGITVGGNDIGKLMVEQGCAWAYTKYLEADSNLPAIQENAKKSGLGIWASSNASAPWDYRAGTVPVTIDPITNKTPIAVSIATTAQSWDRVFDWAEHAFSDTLIGGSSNIITSNNFIYRCYQTGFCIGYQDKKFFVYDGKEIRNAGSEDDLIKAVSLQGF